MFGWLLNCVYGLLIVAVSPVLLWKRLRHGKYRRGWSSKLRGRVPMRSGDRPCVWLHAVSVGEVIQLQGVIEHLKQQRPDVEVAISTTTQTGYDLAKQRFGEHHVFFAPLDFTWAIRNAITRIRPSVMIFVELELWPNWIRIADEQGVPLVLINGRISEKSFKGYRRIRRVMRSLLPKFAAIAVQNECYAHRIIQLGADPQDVFVTGSLKWDNVQTDRDNPETERLRNLMGLRLEEKIIIAGSTQEIEERHAIDAYRSLRDCFPNLRLIVVPRHPERFDDCAAMIEQAGLPLWRRSTGEPVTETADRPVMLLDTIGELSACWGLANIAFVGGTFSDRGGQNMIEPAGYGAAVMFGPNYWNFQQIADALLEHDAARVVMSADELKRLWHDWLIDPETRTRLGHNAREFVMQQSGAIERSLAPLLSSADGLLPKPIVTADATKGESVPRQRRSA